MKHCTICFLKRTCARSSRPLKPATTASSSTICFMLMCHCLKQFTRAPASFCWGGVHHCQQSLALGSTWHSWYTSQKGVREGSENEKITPHNMGCELWRCVSEHQFKHSSPTVFGKTSLFLALKKRLCFQVQYLWWVCGPFLKWIWINLPSQFLTSFSGTSSTL